MKNQTQQQFKILQENLRAHDLKNFVSDCFSVDQFKSKMGEDRDIVVLGFKVKEKNPAVDLMEFMEKGYPFILDADISSGEEHDGQYQVFAEIERTSRLPIQLQELLRGVGRLVDVAQWRFRYQKTHQDVDFSEQAVVEHIPTTQEAYDNKILEFKNKDVKDFFNQGITEVALDSNGTLTFSRPYAGDLTAKFEAIGRYDKVKDNLPGPISLDEASQSQVVFLNKFLGPYSIDKIGNKFLIRNNDQAIIIEKDRW